MCCVFLFAQTAAIREQVSRPAARGIRRRRRSPRSRRTTATRCPATCRTSATATASRSRRSTAACRRCCRMCCRRRPPASSCFGLSESVHGLHLSGAAASRRNSATTAASSRSASSSRTVTASSSSSSTRRGRPASIRSWSPPSCADAGATACRWRCRRHSPDTPVPIEQFNSFDYVPTGRLPDAVDDRRGYRCPIGSHIRRMNPRHFDGRGQQRPEAPHRAPRAAVRAALRSRRSPDDGIERGLLGLFIGVSLKDQFEFLMSDWANKGAFAPGPARHARSDPRRSTRRRARSCSRSRAASRSRSPACHAS